MEEDSGAKAAKVTRLRRRPSVEMEETRSPSTPSTPTKKRTTRLAAKPQLELIDEHAVTNSPKRTTRKSISREIAEPEEKPITPARRSARTKSNTSLVLESEEKTTPASRSTRIKSNTSLISEPSQSVMTPRAMRAIARRNSQLESDTEAPQTPSRTRRARKVSTNSTSSTDQDGSSSVNEISVTPGRIKRTRKSSSSNIDLAVETAQPEKQSLINEVIVEEPEGNVRKSTSEKDIVASKDNTPTRKSPRLNSKKGRKSNPEDTNESPNLSQKDNENNNNVSKTEESIQILKSTSEAISQSDISVSSANLIKNLDKKLSNKNSKKNKSLSDVEDTIESKKRKRTKSWTTLYAPSPPIEDNFYSDNEIIKKKHKQRSKIFIDKRTNKDAGAGDGPDQNYATQNKDECNVQHQQSIDTNLNISKSNRKSTVCEQPEKSISEPTKDVDISNESNKENILSAPVKRNSSEAALLFEEAPHANVKSMVYIEDSDSSSDNMKKQTQQKDVEDQCVPIVLDQPLNSSEVTSTDERNIFAINAIENVANNDSVEPMDIDVTIPENISLSVLADEDKQCHKSSLCLPQETESISKVSNKSKRKSSASFYMSPMLDNNNSKIKDEEVQQRHVSAIDRLNKSKRKSSFSCPVVQDNESENVSKDVTLEEKPRNTSDKKIEECDLTENNSQNGNLDVTIDDNKNSTHYCDAKRKSFKSNSLSHDKTATENKSTLVLSQIKDISCFEKSVSKTPQRTKEISKSLNIYDTNKDSLVNKNLTLNYMTSTPVQQKNSNCVQINTSVINQMNESKQEEKLPKVTSPKNFAVISKNSTTDEDSSASDEESSQDNGNLFNSQAEVAGDDYESGDSQDDEERQYERENEIIQKGETLDSEEDISDDSDYEKDSFVVSSLEEDNNLLSGSENDLDLSDNELTLSAKSRKKYDERKLKEQKNASREMFEARHGIKTDAKPKNSNRNRLDSTLLKSDEDIMPPKKKKRMRLESTLETSLPEDSTFNNDEGEIGYKKKKSKRLSESVCDESSLKEKEISICNQDAIQKVDPLSVQVKHEPKTPQKDFEISTVHITDDVEQININEDESIVKFNQTRDPLQESVIVEEDSISENEDIANNYESILRELNNDSKRQVKSHDISLNLNKKEKSKAREAVIDELNLTRTKISKRDNSLQSREKSVQRVFKKLADSDDSSNSIDLRLLFSDDTTSNEGNADCNEKKNVLKQDDSFISLKKTRASTDISRDMILTDGSQTSSNKKKNKKEIADKKYETKSDGGDSPGDSNNMNFFIDTEGAFTHNAMHPDISDPNDAPLEVLYVSKDKKKLSVSQEPKLPINENKKIQFHNHDSEKKKKNKQPYEDNAIINGSESRPTSDKKKNKRISESNEDNAKNDDSGQRGIFLTDETSTESKKRKRKQSVNNTDDIESKVLNNSQEGTSGNKKKKLKIVKDDNNIETDLPHTNGHEKDQPIGKKTKKNNLFDNHQQPIEASDINRPRTKTGKKRKERDDDEVQSVSKIFKENSFDGVIISRLPSTVIDRLDDVPRKEIYKDKTSKIVSTSNFEVQETTKRKNKPSAFLEETVCLNNKGILKKKFDAKKPKVLPFVVSTSHSGFTTNFQVNVISQRMDFVAQNSEVPNFKNNYLNNKKIKKLGMYDLYKKQRNIKLSKY